MDQVFLQNAVTWLIVVSVVLFITVVTGAILAYRYYKNTATREQNFKQQLADHEQEASKLREHLTALAEGLGSQGKEIADQGKEINNLNELTAEINAYNKTMARLEMEAQKIYLYGVALQLKSMIDKNQILVDHGLISKESARSRNGQLQSLEGGMKMYADSLGYSSYEEDQERIAHQKSA